MVGMWGLMAVPFSNEGASFAAQLTGLVTILVWVFVSAFIVWLVIKAVMGLRVSEEEEIAGLDVGEHGMQGYPDFVLRFESLGSASYNGPAAEKREKVPVTQPNPLTSGASVS